MLFYAKLVLSFGRAFSFGRIFILHQMDNYTGEGDLDIGSTPAEGERDRGGCAANGRKWECQLPLRQD